MNTKFPAPPELPRAEIPKIADYDEWVQQITKRLKEHSFSCTNPSMVFIGHKNDHELFSKANTDLISSRWSVHFISLGNSAICLVVSNPAFLEQPGMHD